MVRFLLPMSPCSALCLGLLVSSSAAGPPPENDAPTRQRAERFDADPGWDALNNRVQATPNLVIQDFGHSETRRAQGEFAGEIGGRIQRCTTPAYYGKSIAPVKSLDDPLRCRGRFVVTETMGMSSLYFGWFNTATMETRPRNWLGLMINGEGQGCEVHLGYNTAGGQSDGIRTTGVGPRGAAVRDFNLIPADAVYTFDIAYDPDANAGHGELTFTLGGEGPFTGGPFHFPLSAEHRKTGATFDAFGFVNPQSAGNWLTIFVDDLVLDGEAQPFDRDPLWLAHGNRDRLDDYAQEGAHQFGFSETLFAGGEQGELGGLIYSAPSMPGYYAADVGRLTLEDCLTASGRVSLAKYGSDGAVCIGWFDSTKRGYPPANVLGVLIDGPTSTPPRFQGWVASSDPTLAHCERAAAPFLRPDGDSHAWRIDYEPDAEQATGQMTVHFDDHEYRFIVPAEIRGRGAAFDRFGIFVHEGGGRSSRVYFDDLEFTAGRE